MRPGASPFLGVTPAAVRVAGCVLVPAGHRVVPRPEHPHSDLLPRAGILVWFKFGSGGLQARRVPSESGRSAARVVFSPTRIVPARGPVPAQVSTPVWDACPPSRTIWAGLSCAPSQVLSQVHARRPSLGPRPRSVSLHLPCHWVPCCGRLSALRLCTGPRAALRPCPSCRRAVFRVTPVATVTRPPAGSSASRVQNQAYQPPSATLSCAIFLDKARCDPSGHFAHTETSFNPPENFEGAQRPEAGRGAGLRPPAKLPALLVQSPASHVG